MTPPAPKLSILITGATGGIGSSIAMHLTLAGYTVIATGTDDAKLKKLKSVIDVRGSGACVTFVSDTDSRY